MSRLRPKYPTKYSDDALGHHIWKMSLHDTSNLYSAQICFHFDLYITTYLKFFEYVFSHIHYIILRYIVFAFVWESESESLRYLRVFLESGFFAIFIR